MKEVDQYQYRTLGPPLYEAVPLRIDRYLSENFPFFSRSAWQTRIKIGQVTVNDRPVKLTYRLQSGDQLRYFFPLAKEPPVNTDLKEIWRSEKLLVIAKPAPLPMHEGGAYRENTLCALLAKLYPENPAPLHRLDRETSGLVLCSHDAQTRVRLTKLFAEHKMEKTYLAIVKGRLGKKRWKVDAPIGDLKESLIRIKKWVVTGGLPAETHFALVAQKRDHALVLAFPKTGRTNQIRIHLAFSGYPILGDKMYHPDEQVFLEFFEKGTTENVIHQTGSSRHCLHALQIKFFDPDQGRKMRFFAKVPKDFADVWRSLP